MLESGLCLIAHCDSSGHPQEHFGVSWGAGGSLGASPGYSEGF